MTMNRLTGFILLALNPGAALSIETAVRKGPAAAPIIMLPASAILPSANPAPGFVSVAPTRTDIPDAGGQLKAALGPNVARLMPAAPMAHAAPAEPLPLDAQTTL